MTADAEDKTDQQSSITIKRNARGEYAFEVKVYEDDATSAGHKLAHYVKVTKAQIAAEIAAEARGE